MKKILPVGGDTERGPNTRDHKWTLTHSYFALMGGFEVVVDDESKAFFPDKTNGTRRMAFRLTADGLILFAKESASLIPDISLQQIQDKSKGSLFAKVLVCFQGSLTIFANPFRPYSWFYSNSSISIASWFCTQCLTRFAQRLGISLLELNTFGHAVCALAIYLAWWRKPLDVEEPEQLRVVSELQRRTIATMCCNFNLDRKMVQPSSWNTVGNSHYDSHFQPENSCEMGNEKFHINISKKQGSEHNWELYNWKRW